MKRSMTGILVPIDFSPHSDLALRDAMTLAGGLGVSLHLLHVVEDPDTWGSEIYPPPLPELRERAFAEAKQQLAACLSPADRERLHVKIAVVAGPVATMIANYADDFLIDVIVMGTHGQTGSTEFLMGGVARSVLRLASCPVLFRQPQRTRAELFDAAEDVVHAPWNCRWSGVGYRLFGVQEGQPAEGLWVCRRPSNPRHSVTDKECAACEFWQSTS